MLIGELAQSKGCLGGGALLPSPTLHSMALQWSERVERALIRQKQNKPVSRGSAVMICDRNGLGGQVWDLQM